MSGDILAQLQAAGSDEEREWLVMQFSLDNLPPATREAVWAAAIPHWFDADFLAALLDEPGFGFENLVALSFVEPFPGRGYNLHEGSRALLLRRLWEEDAGRYRELSQRAAAYCGGQDQTDTGWRVETVYHQLLGGEGSAVDAFVSQGIEWHNRFEYDKLETLTRLILEAVQAGRLTGRAAAWTYYRQARLHITFSHYREAQANLELALNQQTDDRGLKANCIQALGDVHYSLAEYGAARERYEEARPIYRAIGARLGEANCIFGLADLDRQDGRWETAEQKYRQALDYYQATGMAFNAALALQRLGHTAKDTGDRAQARDYYQAALDLFTQIGSPTAKQVRADLESLEDDC
jgi:tetratricopeptide (TPR) repeat protein